MKLTSLVPITTLITLTVGFSSFKVHAGDSKLSVRNRPLTLSTQPAQVLLYSRPNPQLTLSQVQYIQYISVDSAGNAYTPQSPAQFVSSDSTIVSISQVSGSTNQCTLTGNAAGTATVKVLIDGIESQSVQVTVLPFTNNFAVAFDGDFLNSTFSTVYLNYNAASGSNAGIVFNSDASDDQPQANSGAASSTIGMPYPFDLSNAKQSVNFSAKNLSTGITTSITSPIRKFVGNGGVLQLPQSNGYANINLSDDRFSKLDRDFTISSWMNPSQPGEGFSDGGQLLTSTVYALAITPAHLILNSKQTTQRLFAPVKPSGAWQNVAVTYVAASRLMSFVVDGKRVGSFTVPNDPRNDLSYNTAVSSSLDMLSVDDLRFWNRALTESELAAYMFIRPALPSSDLIAEFNFDRADGKVERDANGGASNIVLSTAPVPSANGPRIIFPTGLSIDLPITPSQFSQRQLSDGNPSIGIAVDAGVFPSPFLLHVEQRNSYGSWQPSDAGFSAIFNSRISSMFHFAPFPSAGIAEIKIPFNTYSPLIVDETDVKVAHISEIGGRSESHILHPLEVNLDSGYVLFQLTEGGEYWVSALTGFNSNLPSYLNPDIVPAPQTEYGYRGFYATVPSGATTYTLTRTMPTSSSTYKFECPSNSVSTNGNVVTISNLGAGANTCYANNSSIITVNGFSQSYVTTDMIILKK